MEQVVEWQTAEDVAAENAIFSRVARETKVREKLATMESCYLGAHNQARTIRNIYSVLQLYSTMHIGFGKHWSFFLVAVMSAFNVFAIIYNFIRVKDEEVSTRSMYNKPDLAVTISELAFILLILLNFLWNMLTFLWSFTREWCTARELVHFRQFRTCERAKYLLKSGRRLQFSLLILLKYANPGNMASLLHKSSSRMNARYWRWFNRKSDQKSCCARGCCASCCFCCYDCFSHIMLAFKLVFIIVLAAGALVAVFLKMMQLSFVGRVAMTNWKLPELVLFGQFCINMAFLSNSYRSKMRGKSELLYGGRDAVKSSTERTAKRTFETMAFLLVRERANLWCAWVLYHALGPEDVNCLWVHDQLEVIPTDMSGAVKAHARRNVSINVQATAVPMHNNPTATAPATLHMDQDYGDDVMPHDVYNMPPPPPMQHNNMYAHDPSVLSPPLHGKAPPQLDVDRGQGGYYPQAPHSPGAPPYSGRHSPGSQYHHQPMRDDHAHGPHGHGQSAGSGHGMAMGMGPAPGTLMPPPMQQGMDASAPVAFPYSFYTTGQATGPNPEPANGLRQQYEQSLWGKAGQ